MNAIVLAIVILFYALYAPYQATLESNLTKALGILIIIAAPLFALILVAMLDFIPKAVAKQKVIKEANFCECRIHGIFACYRFSVGAYN